ncbi:hypothetical protein Ait01nite_030240 [Actinoplanes italicus]|uniref:Uncharacterized protein n=1 Tax=Actinoplanes italicus TaxID=113567 RepID=A0A2T0KIX4_9ACTN|nr:hypothetical protein [Actinoplanes italicus]PRX23481.1 hypothetical protein CLV67_103229 [Actinoplanes italicus]GIE29979.1 hypothetical protein Ait01nite_030240 [Actinoplanes italicus]
MTLSLGCTVFYTLSAGDVDAIDRNLPLTRGHQVRNLVSVGQVLPAVVTAIFDGSDVTANLKVQLDGEDCYWATSRTFGDRPGTWFWPPRV